jgi:hypothetical protein
MNRRDFDRLHHSVRATLQTSEGRLIEGHTRDLSLGGLFLETDEAPPRATRGVVRFHRAPDDPPCLEVSVVVSRTEEGGVGLRFIEIDVDLYRRIRTLHEAPAPIAKRAAG